MKIIETEIRSIDDAVESVLNVLADHPERNFAKAKRDALAGRERKFPVQGIKL